MIFSHIVFPLSSFHSMLGSRRKRTQESFSGEIEEGGVGVRGGGVRRVQFTLVVSTASNRYFLWEGIHSQSMLYLFSTSVHFLSLQPLRCLLIAFHSFSVLSFPLFFHHPSRPLPSPAAAWRRSSGDLHDLQKAIYPAYERTLMLHVITRAKIMAHLNRARRGS